MAHNTLSKTLGLLIALPVMLAGMTAGAAHADEPAGAVARTVGTQVTSGSPSAAGVQDSGNDGAWVVGVPFCANIFVNKDCWGWDNACPSAHFCIYTYVEAGLGKIFSFYHCRNGGSDWALRAWNGTGYYINNNTGGAPAYLKGASHNVLLKSYPDGPNEAGPYDYRPVYYVQAC